MQTDLGHRCPYMTEDTFPYDAVNMESSGFAFDAMLFC